MSALAFIHTYTHTHTHTYTHTYTPLEDVGKEKVGFIVAECVCVCLEDLEGVEEQVKEPL